MRRVDFFTTHAHYAAHLAPIWDALPPDRRGSWYRKGSALRPGSRLTVVASYGNLKTARTAGHRPVVYCEHGAGFSYGTDHPAYAGGADRDGVVLFISPNEYVARRNRATHPEIPEVVVGCPKLDPIFRVAPIPLDGPPLVVLSFHFDCRVSPESRSAFPHYKRSLLSLRRDVERRGWRIAGHGHPLGLSRILSSYSQAGIPVLRSFADVLAVGGVYVVDTSSTAYEFAATGRPVLTLNAPWYRREVRHGLRFWENIPGLQCDHPHFLAARVAQTVEDPSHARRMRRDALSAVYPIQDGTSAARAAMAIVEALQ